MRSEPGQPLSKNENSNDDDLGAASSQLSEERREPCSLRSDPGDQYQRLGPVYKVA